MPGSHGSLTKAGKVRFFHNQGKTRYKRRIGRRSKTKGWGTDNVDRTANIERDYRPKEIPRRRNKRNYEKRILRKMQVGQQDRTERWKK